MNTKRNITFTLTPFETGWLRGALPTSIMEQMRAEAPILALQFDKNFTKVYAESEGHPYQKQAKRELKEIQAKLDTLFAEEEKV